MLPFLFDNNWFYKLLLLIFAAFVLVLITFYCLSGENVYLVMLCKYN